MNVLESPTKYSVYKNPHLFLRATWSVYVSVFHVLSYFIYSFRVFLFKVCRFVIQKARASSVQKLDWPGKMINVWFLTLTRVYKELYNLFLIYTHTVLLIVCVHSQISGVLFVTLFWHEAVTPHSEAGRAGSLQAVIGLGPVHMGQGTRA